MRCPACEYDNIPGADLCEECGLDLAGLDVTAWGVDPEDPQLAVTLDTIGVRFHGARHENDAIAMAEGYAAASGRLGVAVIGRGPATANGLHAATYASRTGSKVLIIYGDGSFGLNGMEYDTAVRFGLPIVGIVGNDAAWGQMMRPQAGIYGSDRLVATELGYTRYDKVVEALGGHGEFVESPDQLRPALERAAASGKPALVNVIIRQDKAYKGGIYV